MVGRCKDKGEMLFFFVVFYYDSNFTQLYICVLPVANNRDLHTSLNLPVYSEMVYNNIHINKYYANLPCNKCIVLM